ncbi:MAG: hypothetical protein SGJ10_09500 [Bacteroidota bacterium]|nr:hypothetical protein [Bacteroidota bacterium]
MELDSFFKNYINYTNPYDLNNDRKVYKKDPKYALGIDILFNNIIETKNDLYIVAEAYQPVFQN